jgi:integrase
MASFRKFGRNWYFRYIDADGKQRELKGCGDRRETENMAGGVEAEVRRVKLGYVDAADVSARRSKKKLLVDHIKDWRSSLVAEGSSERHADHTSNRLRRLVAVITGSPEAMLDHRKMKPNERGEAAKRIEAAIATALLSDLSRTKVQDAIAKLRDADWSLQTCNHYRAAARAFSKWCYEERLTKEDVLHAVKGYNAKEDRRHDRRTVSVNELMSLIDAARRGRTIMGMSGLARSLCYRLAAVTGLRYAELGTITPESFDWEAPSVTVAACYTKNGDPATLPMPNDLVDDLRAYVATIEPGTAVFPLPAQKGAKMLRFDLKSAGIAYEDESGLFFDFHSLRCEMATLADAAGVSPRVVQRLMRHSSLELTGRYTRPRAGDIDAAAGMLPSLKPEDDQPEILAATGTDGRYAETLPLPVPYARDGIETESSADPCMEGNQVGEDLPLPVHYADAETYPNGRAATGGIGADSAQTAASGSCCENRALGASVRPSAVTCGIEAPPGFEPGMEVLQTSALPLGYGAATRHDPSGSTFQSIASSSRRSARDHRIYRHARPGASLPSYEASDTRFPEARDGQSQSAQQGERTTRDGGKPECHEKRQSPGSNALLSTGC